LILVLAFASQAWAGPYLRHPRFAVATGGEPFLIPALRPESTFEETLPMRRIISTLALTLALLSTRASFADDTATFSDTGLSLNGSNAGMPDGSGPYNNSSGGFTSGGQSFNNVYDPTFGSWSGFSVSAATNTTTAGFLNQYAAITGAGNGTADYGVVFAGAYDPTGNTPPAAYVNLTGNVQSIDLTNTTYAYLSMTQGDQFAGAPYTTGDFFDVVITGYTGQNGTGVQTGSVTYFLADYTSPSSTPVDTWNTVGLTALGSAESIGFSFQSSDTGEFGINTPTYVAVDNLVVAPSLVPEPSSWVLCVTGCGIGFGAMVRRRRLARISPV
jgi:Domain of unknown function (DUF4465)